MTILDLANQDFSLIRETPNVYGTKEHSSLKFFVDTNSWFWYSKRVGGNIIFYLKFFWNLEEDSIEDYIDLTTLSFTKNNNSNEIDEPYVKFGKRTYNKYLKDRKISFETFSNYNIEFDPISESIILPIENIKGNKVGIVKRKIHSKDKKNRYKFILWDNKPPLWQLSNLNKINSKTRILLFEGLFSSMLWKQTLYNQNIETFALMGAFPSKQIKELLNGLNVFYIADNDEAGLNTIQELRKLGLEFTSLTPNIYPDEMTENQIKWMYLERIKNAK